MIKKQIKAIGESFACATRRCSRTSDPAVVEAVETLKLRGYVVLDHLINSEKFMRLKRSLCTKIEQDLEIKTPCLSQALINPTDHKDLIENNFLANDNLLIDRGLTFSRSDINSYDHMLKTYEPSTLTVPMPSEKAFYDIWLDPFVIEIVSNFMGFVPMLTEAYIRRNFPCKYPVMNHNWHRDTNHHRHLLKAFIFFTDCNINTGAHHYIASSASDNRFQSGRYYTDEEIHNVWPKHSKDYFVSNVKEGSIIIEDTRGLHKAGIPNKNYRDLGFAVFLPPNLFNKNKSYYKVDARTFDTLSQTQKAFIPTSNISKG